MLSHIKLPESDALAETELRQLGQINVVCGKNNSGKSTLLWSLNPERMYVGKSLSRDDADRIAEATLSSTTASGWRTLEHATREEYGSIVRQVIERRSIWWTSDRELFYEELHDSLEQREQFRALGRMPGPTLVGAFLQAFPQPPASILIPAKRSLEPHSELGISIRDASGRGVLTALFVGKNQVPGDPQHELHRQIREAFEEITEGHSFEVSINAENKLALSFRNPSDKWLWAGQCGLGLHELLVLLYFAIESSTQLLRVEEPENHLHPHLQRRLLRFFRSTGKQFIVATHSNIFLDVGLVDRVFYTTAGKRVVVDDATSRAAILADLGYEVGDNLVSDLVILVEGPTDTAALQPLLMKMGLSDRIIKVWPIGGDIMGQVDLSVFSERYRIIALIDRDPGSARLRRRFEKRCHELRIRVHRLERYSIENYFSVRVLREIYKGQIDEDITAIPPDISVEKFLGVGIKGNNRRIAEAMELTEVQGTDLYQFLQHVASLSGGSPQAL